MNKARDCDDTDRGTNIAAPANVLIRIFCFVLMILYSVLTALSSFSILRLRNLKRQAEAGSANFVPDI